MPVPVPLYIKTPAHPVYKNNHFADSHITKSTSFDHIHRLFLPPQGLPPAFATREEWIDSLPEWRKNKPRSIWKDDSTLLSSASGQSNFLPGLAVADNALVIKGAPAQACIPPVSTLIASADGASGHPLVDMYPLSDEETDDDMSPMDSVSGWRSDNDFRSLPAADHEMTVEQASDVESLEYASDYQSAPYGAHYPREDRNMARRYSFEEAVFTPLYEDSSPELAGRDEAGSSPIGPATPFADYIDRAVADVQVTLLYDSNPHTAEIIRQTQYEYPEECYNARCYQCHHAGPQAQVPPAPEPVVTPSATSSYKKLAEPLSEWVANFVWKVCTTGMSLPSTYAQPTSGGKHYPTTPPSHLAKNTHSLLLSTLLQPSGVLLALWYIVKLPVYFGPTCISDHDARALRFRAELLGEPHMMMDRDAIESYAPFRLILLGCMLANKWLDDHTFSNKTWHTISNVPIRALNKLESLALDLFNHDLSISTGYWSEWLTQLHGYHASLSSPAFPQPISRPSTSPHTVVRITIENLMSACNRVKDMRSPVPEPIFLGGDDKKVPQSLQPYRDDNPDVLEIDLDEDGPLREEYMPRRRVSGAGPLHQGHYQERVVGKMLPPPAKWSPEADEPISRNEVRPAVHFIAPPISQLALPAPPLPPLFHQGMGMVRGGWPADGYATKHESHLRPTYGHLSLPPPVPPPHMMHTQPAYGYDYGYQPSHTRSHSVSYNPVMTGHPMGHARTYSQSRFDGGYGDARMADPRYIPPALHSNTTWAPPDRNHYSTYGCPMEHHRRISLQA